MKENTSATTSALTDIAIVIVIFLVAIPFLNTLAGKIISLYTSFLEWMYSDFMRTILTTVFTLLDALLAFFIFVVVRRHMSLSRLSSGGSAQASGHTLLPKDEIRENWKHIGELIGSSNSSDWSMALIRADALLDDTLQHMGYEGTTLAERLAIVDPTILTSAERIWSSHRLRNIIAHDPLKQFSKDTISHALIAYEHALKELGMMEAESAGNTTVSK